MNNAQLINQSSGEVEIYTPSNIIEAARCTMGEIGLDPASSVAANLRIKANHFFTKEQDGLSKAWGIGYPHTVWMNHPFSKGEEVCDPVITGKPCKKKTCRDRGAHCLVRVPGNDEWINKLLGEYADGNVKQACCITFAATSEGWFRPLLDFPQCYLTPRTNYLLPDGSIYKGVTKGSVVTYLGKNYKEFEAEFSPLGVVKVRWMPWMAVKVIEAQVKREEQPGLFDL